MVLIVLLLLVGLCVLDCVVCVLLFGCLLGVLVVGIGLCFALWVAFEL